MNYRYWFILILISIFLIPSIIESYSQTTVPSKPTGLIADDVSPTKIELSWETPNDGGSPITGYKIEFRIIPSTSYSDLITNTGSSQTTYSHTGVATGKDYAYRVYAINSEGTSEPSAEALGKTSSTSSPPENIVPNPPTSLKATDVSPTQIDLSWEKPTVNNGPTVKGYKIEVKVGSGSYSVLVTNTDNTKTLYSHTDVTIDTTYTYRVSAINSVGTSDPSNEDSATATSSSSPPIETKVPNSPRSLKASPLSPTKIILTWKEPTDNGGPVVTDYKIEYKTGEEDYSVLVENTGFVTSYEHTGLNESNTYTYRVFAINSVGTGSASATASAKPKHTDVPTGFTATAVSPTSIQLSWNAPSQTYGMSIGGYKIEEEISQGVYQTVKETSGKDTSITITGLTTDKTYTYVVSARLGVSSTPRSDEASATPTTSSVPPVSDTVASPPTGLKAVASSPVQIDLSWNAPSNNGGTPIIGYRIDVKVGSGSYTTLVQNTDSTVRTYSHTERTTDTTYTYRVSAINSVGTSGPSGEASATPTLSSEPEKPDTVPASPAGLKANAVSPTQINLSWNPPSNDGGEPVTGYKIEVKSGTGSYSVLTPNAGKTTSYSHTGLVSDTTYTYKVSAINSVGTSTASAEASATPIVIEEKEEPKSSPVDFIESENGAQYYLDRYNNEPAYKSWFDENFPDYTIEEAIELAIPGSFPEEPEIKPILPFVDPKQDPQYYINRYNSESSYKSWFDANFPDYTIYEAVGVEPPAPPSPPDEGICGSGTVWVDGVCELTKTPSGGCLIATATYGSELSYEVQQLRELRDSTLLSTSSGSAFMNGFNSIYYSFSPTIADWERQNPAFKESVKIAITPLISTLGILNYVDIDSEEEVLGFGIGLILLNLGMYFVLPAIIVDKALRIYKSRKQNFSIIKINICKSKIFCNVS